MYNLLTNARRLESALVGGACASKSMLPYAALHSTWCCIFLWEGLRVARIVCDPRLRGKGFGSVSLRMA